MHAPARTPLRAPLGRTHLGVLVASLMLTLFLAALNQTMVGTATPRILADLGRFDLIAWMFTSYLITSTVVVPLAGTLSDVYGRRTFLLGGIGVFTAGAALSAMAPSMPWYIGFRAIAGVGGGTILAAVYASLGDLFPPAQRGRYTGLFTGVFSVAAVVGPTLGGWGADHVGWRWLFSLNVPIALVAAAGIWWLMPVQHGGARPRVDYLGAAALSGALVLLLYALAIGSRAFGGMSWQVGGLLGACGALLTLFAVEEMRHPDPVVPLGLFRNRVFLVANLIAASLGMALFGVFMYLPTYVQTSLATSATLSGIIATPQALGLLVASTIGGHIMTRTGGYWWQIRVGAVVAVAGTVLLTRVTVDTRLVQVSAAMVVLGAGIGLMLPAASVAAQNAAPGRYLGVTASAGQFFWQVGGIVGTALAGALLLNAYQAALADRLLVEMATRLPAGVVAKFENPTVMVNDQGFRALAAEVRALPDGERLLALTVVAVRESVAAASREVFIAAAVVAGVCLVFAFAMPAIPLRRSADGDGDGPPETT